MLPQQGLGNTIKKFGAVSDSWRLLAPNAFLHHPWVCLEESFQPIASTLLTDAAAALCLSYVCIPPTHNHHSKWDKIQWHLPNSPPAIEKSRGSIVHFCISWARETACLLAASTPHCINLVMAAMCSSDVSSDTSDTSMPAATNWPLATRVSFDVGADVVSSTSVWQIPQALRSHISRQH